MTGQQLAALVLQYPDYTITTRQYCRLDSQDRRKEYYASPLEEVDVVIDYPSKTICIRA